MEGVGFSNNTCKLDNNHLEHLWRLNFPPPYENAIPPCKIEKDSCSPMRKNRAWWEFQSTIGNTLWPAYKQQKNGEMMQVPNVW